MHPSGRCSAAKRVTIKRGRFFQPHFELEEGSSSFNAEKRHVKSVERATARVVYEYHKRVAPTHQCSLTFLCERNLTVPVR